MLSPALMVIEDGAGSPVAGKRYIVWLEDRIDCYPFPLDKPRLAIL
jgi:hypothetical protein